MTRFDSRTMALHNHILTLALALKSDKCLQISICQTMLIYMCTYFVLFDLQISYVLNGYER